MDSNKLRNRTKQFALRISRLIDALPNTIAGRNVADQLFRAGTSVAANYRAACRGRSKKEFSSKLHIVLEESDETVFWFEFIIEGNLLPKDQVELLLIEANELTAIFATSYKTAKENK